MPVAIRVADERDAEWMGTPFPSAPASLSGGGAKYLASF